MIKLRHRARSTNRIELSSRIRRQRFRGAARIGAIFFAAMILCAITHNARAASIEPARSGNAEVQVFASADESSPVIESVRDGASLSPIAEMTGAGGLKWFMVKTKSGNVGWIKAGDTIVSTKIGDHFRSLPMDAAPIGSASRAPEATTSTTATGAITIPIKIYGTKAFVPVSFTNGNSTAVAYLALDTGASQTMISKRIATDLRLFSIASQPGVGVGGVIVTDVGVVDLVKVGGAAIKHLPVMIHDLTPTHGFEGLLGFDFLGRFQMSVDSEKQVLVLTPRKN